MIPSPDAVALVIDALNDIGAPYLITGSIASTAYSQPRATADADFVVDAAPDRLQALFVRLGAEFEHEPQMSFETVTGKTQHKFRHRSTKFLVEIFEARMDDPHEQSRFDRRRRETILNRLTYFPTAEDVVVGKLRWFKQIHRVKDRGDLLLVLKRQWDNLDWPYIEHWCREHGTSEVLQALMAEVQSQRA